MNKKICFIGHRHIYNYKETREKLYNIVEEEIKNGCKFFTMGTHGEFDEMALSVCRELRKVYTNIEIEVVITSFKTIEPIIYNDPIFGDEKYIPYSDVKTTMYDIEEEYYKRKIVKSNQKMIDNCDALICYVNKKHNPSGAKLAMNYAKRKSLKIINIYHNDSETKYYIKNQ